MLEVAFLDATLRLEYPSLVFTQGSPAVPDHVLALVLLYFARSSGAMPTGRPISFAELPDGGFYVTAFRGYTAALLARRFGADPERLESAVRSIGGSQLEAHSDRAWRVQILPKVPVILQWWDGDDEFEPRAELLFDETAPSHLTTDGCAVAGSWLTTRLLGYAESSSQGQKPSKP